MLRTIFFSELSRPFGPGHLPLDTPTTNSFITPAFVQCFTRGETNSFKQLQTTSTPRSLEANHQLIDGGCCALSSTSREKHQEDQQAPRSFTSPNFEFPSRLFGPKLGSIFQQILDTGPQGRFMAAQGRSCRDVDEAVGSKWRFMRAPNKGDRLGGSRLRKIKDQV